MKILGFGHCPIDETYRVDHRITGIVPPEKRGPRLARSGGGSVANTLCLLGELGHDCHMLGNRGDDAAGDEVEADMRRHNVHPHLLRKKRRRTPVVACVVGHNSERDFEFDWENAPADFPTADLSKSDVNPKDFDLLVTEFFGDAAHALAKHFRLIVFAGQMLIDPTPEKNGDIVQMRARSVLTVTGPGFIHASLSQPVVVKQRNNLRGPPVPAIDVVTMGPEGIAIGREGGATTEQPAPRGMQIVDTTGAGDAFLGALIHLLPPDMNPTDAELAEACRKAQRVGALCCGTLGARGYLSERDKVRKALGK